VGAVIVITRCRRRRRRSMTDDNGNDNSNINLYIASNKRTLDWSRTLFDHLFRCPAQ
jgi:hypothetical protein